ncbi:hypothetical protein HYW87_04915 [Candidatus Roizmanbacteria bacterium]|nr:hypothetical protein [Candidatus Roizmanbacteria bacterium]
MKNVLIGLLVMAGVFMTMPVNALEKKSLKQMRAQKKSLIEKVKNKVKKLRFNAQVSGTISAINDSTLTVSSEGKTYTIFISERSKTRRRFWGKADLSEFSVGNKVNVIGKWRNPQQSEIDAILVRNLSIQKRWGVFFGDVKSKSSNSFVISTPKKSDTSVFFDVGAKFVSRNEKPISFSDLKVEDRVRVKGIWDVSLNKLIEVEQVKDFSILN